MGLMNKITTLQVHHAFLYISLLSPAQRREMTKF